MDPTARVLELARELGFDLAGVAPLRPPRDAARFESWLEAGHHADMDWLMRQRERIVDPRRILPDGRSLVVVGLAHGRPAHRFEEGGRVARYALGRDYHNRMGKLLRKLARALRETGLVSSSRGIVDAGPLLERSHAEEAGLGFASKAANLLHRDHGPWFFLGELLVDLELEPTAADGPLGSCGTCTACLDACPTDAIRAPGVVDANLCISYHTIENRGSIPHALRGQLDGWVFGCDVCSEVCPWGTKATAPGADSETTRGFGTHAAVASGSLVDWLHVPQQAFAERFRGSPLQRPKRDGLARNAALALAHAPHDEGREALLRALECDPSPRVREAAYWSLLHAHEGDAGVVSALERAGAREDDAAARDDMRGSRATDGS